MHTGGFISSPKLPRDSSYNLRNNYVFDDLSKFSLLSHFLSFFAIFVDDALLGLKSTNYDVKMFFNSRLFDLYTSFPSH